MLFIGHTRFSLFNPKSSSWRATDGIRFASAEEYQNYLYSDERLGLRSDVFVNLSLPQIELGRTGHDVLHMVSYSDSLPRKYQVLLENAAVKYPFLVLDRHEENRKPTDIHDLARDFLTTSGRELQGQAFATYRLDDDDLLSTDYFDQMSPYVTEQNAGMQVSLATGITGLHNDSSFSNLRQSYWPMHSMGHLSVCAFQVDGSVKAPIAAPHNLSDRSNPVIVDARKPAYFWLRHLTQDTSIDYSAEEAKGQLVQSMQRYPAVRSNEDVLAIFPVLEGRILNQNLIQLVENPVTLIEQNTAAGFPRPLSSFKIEADLDAASGATPNNALISFDLVDTEGQPLDGALHAPALASAGLARSGNAAVGFYRYVTTVEGRHAFEFSSSLPEGILCQGVSIRRWGRSETQITLHSLSVRSI